MSLITQYMQRLPHSTVNTAIGSFFLTAAVATLTKGSIFLAIGAGCFALTATYADSFARALIESFTGHTLHNAGRSALCLRAVIIFSVACVAGPAFGITTGLIDAFVLSALSMFVSWFITRTTDLMPEWHARRANLYLML